MSPCTQPCPPHSLQHPVSWRFGFLSKQWKREEPPTLPPGPMKMYRLTRVMGTEELTKNRVHRMQTVSPWVRSCPSGASNRKAEQTRAGHQEAQCQLQALGRKTSLCP